ncbi:protein kinase domain-containing protein [Aphanothece sacrum]|nr:protein kinase [Aphanothece sacrum]
MRCLNCHLDGLSPQTELCPQCGAHIPSLLREVLPQGTYLRCNQSQGVKSGTYCLDYAMGKGSFGITYRAHHQILNDVVAIKEFYPSQYATRNQHSLALNIPKNHRNTYQRSLARFLEEGRILAKLNHPNVVQVRDLFEESNTAYLVMDLVQGKTLLRELDSQPHRRLPVQRVEALMGQLVDALETIHQAGIYHLDLKPENLVLTAQDKLIVIDFGAATQAIHARAKKTRSFTECYAPPELVSGGEIGPESDLFEMGMILYEMLTGTLPHPAMTRLMEGDKWRPQGLEGVWYRLVMSAIALKRKERPKNVREWWQKENLSGVTLLGPFSQEASAGKIDPLKGYFTLPMLQQQGMEQRLGRGCIRGLIPLDLDGVMVLGAGGTSLLNFSSRRAGWEIDCPTELGAVSGDKRLLALVWQEQIYLWDLTQGQFWRSLQGHKKQITSIALSNNGSLLVSGSKDETVRVWDSYSGEQLHQFSEPIGWVTSVAITKDGQLIASGCGDGTIRLWDRQSGQEKTVLVGHEGRVDTLTFSGDGKLLASGGRDRKVRVWLVNSSELQFCLEGHTDWVSQVVFSGDNHFLASTSEIDDKSICIWSVENGQEMARLRGHWNRVRAIAFCQDSRYLVSGADDYTIRLWDILQGKTVHQLHQHTNWVYGVACSADGRWVGTGNNDGTIRLWDIVERREVHVLQGHEEAVSSVAFSSDSRWLVSGSWDETVRLWDVHSGKLARVFSGHDHWVKSVAFSPNNQFIASGSWDKTVRLWEVHSRWLTLNANKPLRVLQGHLDDVECVAFSPDSQLVASGSDDKTVRIWEVSSGQQVKQFEGHTYNVETVAFSPDGQFIASGSRDKTVRLWHILSGKEMHVFRGHLGYVNCVAFSPNGNFIASGSTDKMIALWDLMSGELLQLFQGHTHYINSVAFSADGSILVSVDHDGVVRLWKIN